MLKPTHTTLFDDRRLRPDAIAFCPQTGANLIASRRHPWYVLFLREGESVRCVYWFRRLLTHEEAMTLAQSTLDRITSQEEAIQLSGNCMTVHRAIVEIYELGNVGETEHVTAACLSERLHLDLDEIEVAMSALEQMQLIERDVAGVVTMLDTNGYVPPVPDEG